MSEKYEEWLADILDTRTEKIAELFASRLALTFLITWSVFEQRCFNGYLRVNALKCYANDMGACTKKDALEVIQYFHERYQDKSKLQNLLHKQKPGELKAILSTSFPELNDWQKWYLSLVVISRYRNNMFHGNKTVQNWLHFNEQIEKCICLMQIWINSKMDETKS
ncbi:MAG: hypothetical protein M9918_22790 [Anaerolineae bacterium]|nr:hypothetical protein [Anaerolineae bacterium]